MLTFCPTQLGHFRGVLKLSLGSDILVVPIRVIGEASTVGTKQPRYGCPGFDKLTNNNKRRSSLGLPFVVNQGLDSCGAAYGWCRCSREA